MDSLATILGVDEERIKEELGDVKIHKMVFNCIRDHFDNDYEKFKKFYKYCKGNIPSLIYKFNEAYQSFELNIVNNDIPFMSEEDEKEIMRMINNYHNSVNDSLVSIKKMLIELNKKNLQVDTSDIVQAYEKETILLQDIFKDINSKLESLKSKKNATVLEDKSNENSKMKIILSKAEKKIEVIKSNSKSMFIIILIIISSFVLGGILI